jgi:tetratricopeptide (TPR) repeat protein
MSFRQRRRDGSCEVAGGWWRRATLVAGGIAALLTGCQATPPLPAALSIELRELGFASAGAAELAGRGEAALKTNRLQDAERLFAQARQAAPGSGFPARRHCEILTALGRRDEALAACKVAMSSIGSVVELRASVGAMLLGPEAPTVERFADAYLLASGAQQQRTDLPYGYAALLDIGRRLGDRQMMMTNLSEMQRVAPDHGETKRAEAALPTRGLWWRGMGWAALLAVTLAAAVRSLIGRSSIKGSAIARGPSGERLRSARGLPIALVVIGVGALGATLPATALAAPPVLVGKGPAKAASAASKPADGSDEVPQADRLSAFAVNDADPEGHLPNAAQANGNPLQFGYLLMDLSAKAQAAANQGDHKAAIKYFRALAKAVPGKAIAHARLCREYEALGDRAAALDACRSALARPGVQADDFDRYVRLTLDHPGDVTRAEKDDLRAVIDHLRAGKDTRVTAADLECQLAARIDDVVMLDACVRELVAAAPRSPRTVTYDWRLALQRGDAARAAHLIERAREVGVQAPGIAKMVEATQARQARWRTPLSASLLVTAALLAIGAWFTGRPRARQVRKLA